MANQYAKDQNRDPISGAPGAHPVGTGVGAGGGGIAGAAIGTAVGGPVGAIVGAAVGAIAGGLAGKGVAEMIDPTAEDAYWRDNYASRPYVEANSSYDDYAPAYRYGWESRGKHAGRTFKEAENDLSAGWNNVKGSSRLGWERAKDAVKDSWHKVERAMPGDADGDGR